MRDEEQNTGREMSGNRRCRVQYLRVLAVGDEGSDCKEHGKENQFFLRTLARLQSRRDIGPHPDLPENPVKTISGCSRRRNQNRVLVRRSSIRVPRRDSVVQRIMTDQKKTL